MIQNPGTATEGNAELLDIRIGADGINYNSAGNAVRSIYKNAIHSTGMHVNSTSYSNILTDVNNAEHNSIYFISNTITKDMVKNLPNYGYLSELITFNYSKDNVHGKCQIYIGYNATRPLFYFRNEQGNDQDSFHWSEWNQLADKKDIEDTLSASFHSTGHLVSPSNYLEILTDANSATVNSLYFINYAITQDMIPNLPKYGSGGKLLTFGYSYKNKHGIFQIYTDNTGLYFRNEQGKENVSYWSKWFEVVDKNFLNNYSLFLRSGKANVSSSNYKNFFEDANEAPVNSIYFISPSITSSSIINNLPEYSKLGKLITFGYNPDSKLGRFQIYTAQDGTTKNYFYIRNNYGSKEINPIWSSWSKLIDQEELNSSINNIRNQIKSCCIFEKVLCVGDSYTSGHIDLEPDIVGNDPSNPNYSWPHYMEKITGNIYYNCGISGATVLSWLTNNNGLLKAQSYGKVQAYIIGLGLNDRSRVELGSYSDIGTDAQTYYGGLSKIVQELNNISPSAKIFIQTMTKAGGRTANTSYNQAIKDVVEYYKDIYPIHLLDLDLYINLYDIDIINNDYIGGHQTAIGYRAFAENLCYVMSDYINNNIQDFQDVYKIPLE